MFATGTRRRLQAILFASGAVAGAVMVFCAMAAPGAEGIAAEPLCRPTPPDAEGPFYRAGAPEREATGSGLVVRGRVLGYPGCGPLADARIEWWHAGPDGVYDDAHRGSQRVGPGGAWRFTTDYPGTYPGRPPHIHFKAMAPGYRTLTTQLYLKPEAHEAEFDLVLRK